MPHETLNCTYHYHVPNLSDVLLSLKLPHNQSCKNQDRQIKNLFFFVQFVMRVQQHNARMQICMQMCTKKIFIFGCFVSSNYSFGVVTKKARNMINVVWKL